MLDRPLAIVDSDHFIIRSTTETLGGGVIVDAHARRMPRFKPEVIEILNVREKGSPEELIIARLEAKKWLELADLMTQITLPAEDVKLLVEGSVAHGEIIQLGQGEHRLLLAPDAWNRCAYDVKKALQEYHSKFPVRTGIPKVELLNKLKLGKYSQLFLDRLVADKLLIDEGTACGCRNSRLNYRQYSKQK